MMQVIEPQFQRDFISLLPKEVGAALPVITSPTSRANTLTADLRTLVVIRHARFYL